jgi:hypothetical protein
MNDKLEHWAFGFTLSMFGIIDSWFVFNGLIFAIGKELYDYKIKGRFDLLDIWATIGGVVTAIIILEIWK